MDPNQNDKPYHPDPAAGYGVPAAENLWEPTPSIEGRHDASANAFYGHDYPYPSVPQQPQPPFDSHRASSSSGNLVESSQYGVLLAQGFPPETIVTPTSYRNLTPGETPSLPDSNQPMQVQPHEDIVEGYMHRPERSPVAGGQPPQAVGIALQYLPSANPNEPINVPLKVTMAQLNEFTLQLEAQPWFMEQRPEPRPITNTDVFVLHGYVVAGAESRLLRLILLDSQGHFHCRIPHRWSCGDKKGQPCDHHVQKLKDAIAHVCEYYRYAPYPCGGCGGHEQCSKRFYTTERRNDHYSKTHKMPDEKVKCPHSHCNAKPMLERNLRRHLRTKHRGLPV